MTGPTSSLEPRSKVWFERGGRVALSDWRVALLEAVDDTGSLTAAAERMGVPYRTAWYKLRDAEEQLGARLVATESGGASGGGTRLTPAGRDAIDRFRRVQNGVGDLIRQRFDEEFGPGGEGDTV
jgi:molybdate transport system regulatory protein